MIVRALSSAALIFYLLTSLLISPLHAVESKVVAQVGSVPVTIFDVRREQQRLLHFNASFHRAIPKEALEKVKREALGTMIEQAYKVNYALDKKITIDKKIIDLRVGNLKGKYKTDKEFKTALGEEDIQDFRTAIERTLLAKKAEETVIRHHINVTEANVRSYYDTNKQMYRRPKQFKASHILVRVDPSANSEERATLGKKAKELAIKARRGENFYNLAYYNSDDRSKFVGGDLGYFQEGQTIPELEDALREMEIGDISEPIKSGWGWHIIKLVELSEARQLDFNDSKVKIREQLEKAAKEEILNSWMSELKSTYPVKEFSQESN